MLLANFLSVLIPKNSKLGDVLFKFFFDFIQKNLHMLISREEKIFNADDRLFIGNIFRK